VIIMPTDVQSLYDAALALPEKDRPLLVERLLDTLPDEASELSHEEFLEELRRRRAEVVSGSDRGIPWSELKDQL
jgi:putative addiction module component (TIGR02574 family)